MISIVGNPKDIFTSLTLARLRLPICQPVVIVGAKDGCIEVDTQFHDLSAHYRSLAALAPTT